MNFEDRLFVYIRLRDEVDLSLEKFAAAVPKTGNPLIRIQMEDRTDLAQEFFRWEMATATAGSILSINPFDQPNVQESKDNTNRLLKKLEQEGRLPELSPILEAAPLAYFGSEAASDPGEVWKNFFGPARPRDYISLQAYLPETPETTQALQEVRKELRDRLGLATTLGYGPRFLHSTGQYHKGGPNTGLFLQLTADDAEDMPIPGVSYTFGNFKRAQAQGDLEALRKHGRRVIRIHLGKDVGVGLTTLRKHLQEGLGSSKTRS
jgi:transaldolase / glucose-6-phosphate isomerase